MGRGGAGCRLLALAVAVLVGLLPNCATAPPPRPDASGFGLRCLAVGAWTPSEAPGRPPGRSFAEANQVMGPLTIRRSFDSSLPVDFAASAAAGDAESGVRSFVSWKPPGGDHRGAAAGRYDRQIAAWARSVPSTGVFATAFHEPENDMTAAEFVAFHRHVHTVVEEANATIRWGPVYMAYWWDPTAPDHYVGDPAAWWPGAEYADFVGLDWYGVDPEPMTASASFRHWYDVMEPTGLPLLIVEYGQYALRPGETSRPAEEEARAAAIRQDAAWIAEHPRITMWMYWQGPGPRGSWALTDDASRQAWRDVAARGCRP